MTRCPSTVRNIILSILLAAAYAISSQTALSQEDAASEADSPKFAGYTLETNALMLVGSFNPGIDMAQISSEMPLAGRFRLVLSSSYAHSRMSDERIEDSQEDSDEGLGVAAVTSTSLGGGVRFYSNSLGDSWYGGYLLRIDYSSALWHRDDGLTARTKTIGAADTLEGGYRWIWDSGLLLRLAAGGSVWMPVNSEVEGGGEGAGDSREDIEDSVRKDRGEKKFFFSPHLDVSLGWVF